MLTSQELLFAISIILIMLINRFFQPRPSPVPPMSELPAANLSSSDNPPESFQIELREEWIPEYDQRTPYNETEIVELYSDIYKLLVKHGYIEEEDVDWPPPEGHLIDLISCQNLGIDPAVISLMQRIPYPQRGPVGDRFYLLPNSNAIFYKEPMEILIGRDIEDNVIEPRRGDIYAEDIIFTHNEIYGVSLILDTKENTIRVYDPYFSPEEPIERPDDIAHYRNCRAAHAPSFLKCYVDKLKTLYLIPCPDFNEDLYVTPHSAPVIHSIFKSALLETYGWPDNFKREEFKQQRSDLWFHARRVEDGEEEL